MTNIIAFTGHRPPKIGNYKIPNPIYDKIYEITREKLIEIKPEKAISGMALGFDTLAVKVCIELGIPFIAAVPFKGQEKAWPRKSQDEYHELLSKADEIVIVSTGGYDRDKMQVRNIWMVDRSDIILACWNGSSGGTKNCIQYANESNKKIIRINPNNLSL